MRAKPKTSTAMKIVAVVLILASAAMLLLPWMKLSLTIDEETYSGGQILDKLAQEQGVSKQEILDDVRESVTNLCRQAEFYNIKLDSDAAFDFVEKLLRGAWSPLALSSILGTVKNAADRMGPAMSMLQWILGGSMADTINKAADLLGTARVVLLVLLILTLVLAVLAVVCALTDHRLGILPYLILALILLLVFAYLVLAVNNNIGDVTDSLDLGIPEDAVSLRIGLGAILCPVLAILGFVAMCLPIGAGEPAASRSAAGPRPVGSGGWKCPRCGAMLRADQRFCLNCGTRRPEAPAPAPRAAAGWKCPTCGTLLKADQHFCLFCGTKRPETPAPAPTPARAPAPKGWTCPGCGAQLKLSQNFCPRCGTKQPELRNPAQAPARTPAPSGWTCPGCGAKLKLSQNFCPHCGTKQPAQKTPAPAQAPVRSPASVGWTCPICGASLREDQKFCPRCGTQKPAQRYGAAAPSITIPLDPLPPSVQTPEQTPAQKPAPTPAPTPAPAPAPKPTPAPAPAPAPRPTPVPSPLSEGTVCAVCGMILADGLSYCPICGTRVGTTTPAESYRPAQAAPVPEPAAETISMEIPAAPTAPLNRPDPDASNRDEDRS